MLQAATYSFRNVPAKVKRELVETWNGLGEKPSFVPNSGFNRCSMYPHVHMNFSSSYKNFIFCISFNFWCFFNLIFFYGKLLWSFVYVIIYCVSAGITPVMSISDGPHPYFFCRKKEMTRSMKEETDGDVFISRQSRHFPFMDDMIKVLFPICTLSWRVNNYVSRQGKGINRRNKSTLIIIQICNLLVLYLLWKSLTVLCSMKLFPQNKRRSTLLL